MGPGPPRHLAHLSNLARIAHAVHLAQTHFGRPAHVATLASKTQLAITIIITMAITITTAIVSPTPCLQNRAIRLQIMAGVGT